MSKYICKKKLTFFLDNFGTKYFEFKERNEYDFAKIVDLFRLKENMDVVLSEDYFFKHFILSSDLENKGEIEDSCNIIKEVDFTLSDKEKLNFQSDLELDFDMEVQSTLQKIQQLLLVKGVEYRRNLDPFHNFNVGSQISGEIPEKVLQGFLLKHLVSYQDMLNDIEQGKLPKIELVEEKMNDILTYYIIQKAQIINRIKKS
jgi:hypothetical protein